MRSNSGVWGCSAGLPEERHTPGAACLTEGDPYGDCSVPRAWEELLHQGVWVVMTRTALSSGRDMGLMCQLQKRSFCADGRDLSF